MARIRRESPTRLAIIQVAIDLFFEKGFSNTTAAAVCRKADIGTGNLTFYFPTKEHILDVLVTMMCERNVNSSFKDVSYPHPFCPLKPLS